MLWDVLVEQAKVGIFVPQDRRDILVKAIGIKDRVGCVCGLGRGVGLKLLFKSSQPTDEVNHRREIEELVTEKIGKVL